MGVAVQPVVTHILQSLSSQRAHRSRRRTAGSDVPDAAVSAAERALRAGAAVPPMPFASLGGVAAPATALREAVTLPLRRPEVFRRYGVRPPGGVLLHGPPGSGKTVLARGAATDAGAHLLARCPRSNVRHVVDSSSQALEPASVVLLNLKTLLATA